MVKVVVGIDGAQDLRRRLRRAGDDLTQLREVHTEIGKRVAALAKPRAPIGPTGNLAATVRASGSKTTATVRMGSKRVPYANAVHWGRRIWPSIKAPEPPSGRKKHTSVIARNDFVHQSAKALDGWIQDRYAKYIDEVINR